MSEDDNIDTYFSMVEKYLYGESKVDISNKKINSNLNASFRSFETTNEISNHSGTALTSSLGNALDNSFGTLNEVSSLCLHKNIIYDKNYGDICTECGLIFTNISFSAEKFNKNSNSERCKSSLKTNKNLEKEVKIFDLDKNIIDEITKYFDYITENRICRAKNRKRILFACIYNVCIKNNIFINPLDYCNKLKLKAKDMSKGLSIFNSIIRVNNDHYFLVIKFILHLLEIFNIDKIHHKVIIIIYNNIKYEKILNVCRSHSIATGLIYYYICLAELDISRKKFESMIKYSKTYLRIAKIINKIFNLNVNILKN